MMHMLIVLLGGAIGAAGRYGLTSLIQQHVHGIFPVGTLVVNATGAFCIGILWHFLDHIHAGAGARLFWVVGVLGGFTTFSAFSIETFNLFRDGAVILALINVLANNVICISLAVTGYYAARWLI